MKKRITIKDLAKMLNLSISTVSRALSDHPDISSETKNRVTALAESMNYSVDLHAKFMRTHESKSIALIIPEINAFFSPDLINGIIQTFDAADYSVVILQTNNSLVKEAEMAKYSLNMSVDGVLIMLSNETNDLSHLEILRKTGIPTLLIDKTLPNEDFTTIKIDDINASYTATQKLIQRGRKNILGIFGNENLEITKSRILGFQRAIYESPDQPKHDFITFKSASSVVPTLTDIFAKRAYDAIFCMSDEILVETYYFLSSQGYKIPQNISLIAISDGKTPYFLYPKISHIYHSGFGLGKISANYMLDIIKNDLDHHFNIQIPTEYVELGSV